MLPFFVALVFMEAPLLPHDFSAEEEDEMRQLIIAVEFGSEEEQKLLKLGAYSGRAKRFYQRVLENPEENAHVVQAAMYLLHSARFDRSSLMPLVLTRLSDKAHLTRLCAVQLLGTMGTRKECAPIIALLSDGEHTVGYAAASALVRLGGKNELAAMNTWLAVTKRDDVSKEQVSGYDIVRKHVVKCQGELKARLDKEKLKD